jgi:hypothetical protein
MRYDCPASSFLFPGLWVLIQETASFPHVISNNFGILAHCPTFWNPRGIEAFRITPNLMLVHNSRVLLPNHRRLSPHGMETVQSNIENSYIVSNHIRTPHLCNQKCKSINGFSRRCHVPRSHIAVQMPEPLQLPQPFCEVLEAGAVRKSEGKGDFRV